MRDVEKALCDFYVNHSHDFHIEKIFLSIGTNDIRYCQDGVGFLTKPLTQLLNPAGLGKLAKMYLTIIH